VVSLFIVKLVIRQARAQRNRELVAFELRKTFLTQIDAIQLATTTLNKYLDLPAAAVTTIALRNSKMLDHFVPTD
jgi:hypothetical protein